ncbi:DUF6233 domain-containing protein [Streptomyces brasiliensis]|uniref:Uncharacterized protein n=1 Tax=Streptomyces brasiliensis TaxID=1954 RepID=A0A917KLJ7_9ACTN|nr:DUF6233 domain-containing protein [Streptomyces brasiliensis]GGJ14403.1 hypothetical protein GCM10010121_026270 [Streptomyces brasiliensis]
MSELPSDPPRLHAILAHLDKQIADTETVAIYLRLQRDAVRAALIRAEGPPPARRRPARPVKGGTGLPALAQAEAQVGFVVQQKRTPNGPEPAVIHVGDCTMIEGTPHRIRDHDARAALTDPNVTGCAFCRPDTELGIDAD